MKLYKLLTPVEVRRIYFNEGIIMKESPYIKYNRGNDIAISVRDEEYIQGASAPYASDTFVFNKNTLEEIEDIPKGTEVIIYFPTETGKILSFNKETQEAQIQATNGEIIYRTIDKFDFKYYKEEVM